MNNIDNDTNNFQKEKIKNLNQFFMKNVLIHSLSVFIVFIISIAILIIILKIIKLDQNITISIVSSIVTFTITTSKSLIDKFLSILQYLISLLTEEQRGFSKNLGIEIDKVEFEHSVNDDVDNN